MANADSEFPLLKYLDELVENLRKLIAPALRGQDEDAVHDARVATRRLKAGTELLDLVVSRKCKRPFEKVTKTLRRQLGPLRDLDVMLGHLSEMKQVKYQRAVAWLADRLTRCREEVVRAARDKAPPSRMLSRLGSWWGLRQEIADASDAAECLLAESVHLRLDAFAEQADELIKSRQESSGSGQRRDASSPPVDPHELRIAGKALRYTLEMAKEQGIKPPKSIMVLFKRMQDYLGLWHDYIVLSERMLSEVVECDLALHDPELVGQILGLADITLRKGQGHLKKVAQVWGDRGQELSRQLRTAFPLTRAAVVEETTPTANPSAQVENSSNDEPIGEDKISDDTAAAPAA
jgi:CHAD domain-containing protein